MGEFATVKTSVWWDIENCGVPRSCDPERIVQNMSSALATAGYSGPISVSAYGDTGGIPNRVQHALSSTGVTLNHVPAGIKDASDKRILVDMLFWAIDNPPPANYLLISGDRDFSNAIHKLKMRRYNILLAQPPNVSQTLSSAAKSIWLWKSLVAGEPPLAQSPYVYSTSSGNIDDLDILKNIYSNSLGSTPHTNPQTQNSSPCDHQSGINGNTDKQSEIKQPPENQSDKVFKPANKKDQKRSNSVGIGSTTQPAFKKPRKFKRGLCTSLNPMPPMVVPQCSRPVRGQGLMCLKCGNGHHDSNCTFEGNCRHCGAWGHKSRVCKRNPDCIIKWELKPPKPARFLAASSPGPVHTTAAAPASQLPPAASSPSSVHMIAAAPTSQSPPAASSPGSIHMRASAPASQLSPAASSPGSAHMTAAAPASQLSPAASSPGSVHMMAAPPASQLPSAASSPGSVHMMAAAAASQLPPAWMPPPGYFWQMAPTVPSPPPALPVAPAALQPGIEASSAPAHSGVYAVPTTAPLDKADVVTPPTSSAPCPLTVVPPFRPVTGQSMLCFKCGGVHRATECTFAGCCLHCGRQGHKWLVCRENPNSIIKREPAPSHVLSASSQALVHTMSLFPASQRPPGWMASPGWFWQAALAMRSPRPGLPLASAPPQPGVAVSSAPPQPGVAVSSAPAHSGVYGLLTPTSLGRPDMVAGGNTSGSEPPPPHHAPHG